MVKTSFDTKAFSADLKAFQDKVERSLDSTVKQAADSISRDTAMADSDIPTIAGSMAVEKVENGYAVTKGNNLANPELAAWIEFGTGNFAAIQVANYPEDWKAMAMYYFINGKGRTEARPSLKVAFDNNTADIGEKVAQKIGK